MQNILSGFGVRLPSMEKWWPLPEDDKVVRKAAPEETMELSGKDFMAVFRSAARPNSN